MTDASQPSAVNLLDKPNPPAFMRKARLRRSEAAEYLDYAWDITIAPSTLAKLACTGGGPGFQRVNRTPLYPTRELDRWAESKLGPVVRSTAEC